MHDDENITRNIFFIPHYRILAWITGATVVSWAGFTLVITKLDPFEATQLALTLFFITFFLGLTGSFTILLFFLKKWRAQNHVYVKHVIISFREGFLLSLCTSLCLALLMLGLLRIWNGLLLVALMMLVEFYLSGRDEN